MDLDKRITQWKKSLHAHAGLEDGFIEELEAHLRDEIDELIHLGKTEDEAFEIAIEKLGHIEQINEQEKIVNTSNSTKNVISTGLIGSFLKVGRRQFRKNGFINIINLTGLTAAFTAILFIALFLNDELSFERHHPNANQIYRLGYEFTGENGQTEKRAFTSGMWMDIIKDDIPSLTDHLRFLTLSYGYIRNEKINKSFYEEEIYWTDPNFFEFFRFKLKQGSSSINLNTMVITESMAEMHFGDQDPIGQQLQYIRRGRTVNFTVTGVIHDPPSNSQFNPRYIAHIDAIDGVYGPERRGWVKQDPRPGYVFSFLKISNEQGLKDVHEKLQTFWNTVLPEQAEFMSPTLTKLVDIHFNPPIKWEMDKPISKSYLYGLMIIGFFILLIALTNFANLTTAQGTKRQKEIGLRKTLGSSRQQLRVQFFMESASLTIIAKILALLFMFVLLPSFNQLVDKNIEFKKVISNPILLSYLTGFTLSVATLAGILPALYFTRKLKANFNLNQFFKTESAKSLGRNTLVALQFSIAIVLIISTITVYNQLQLINNGKLGEGRETILGIRTSRMGTDQQAQTYINEINSLANVQATTLGMHLPRQSGFGRINTKYFVREVDNEAHFWNKFDADGGFAKTYDLEFVAGTDFTKSYDTTSYILNEAAVIDLGLTPNEAIGLFLKEDSIAYTFGHSDGIVIGVVRDFAYKSVKEKVEPLVIAANTLSGGALSVKLGAGDKQLTIKKLEELWNEIYPGRPFETWFLDEEFGRLYNQERRLGKLIPMFSGLAILIALFGLFALTAYTSDLRKKEIGIRKVLGCTTSGIIRMLSTQYLKIIGIAMVIGIPIAAYSMNYWLDNFTYRVDVNVLTVIFSVGFILILSLATVAIKSLKVAKANPVESLKHE